VWEEILEELLKKQKKKGQSMHETKLRMHIYLRSRAQIESFLNQKKYKILPVKVATSLFSFWISCTWIEGCNPCMHALQNSSFSNWISTS
jgi:hypothetical protein